MKTDFPILTNFQLDEIMKGEKNFKGVLSKDLFKGKIANNESGIINLQDNTLPGTHWTGYVNLPGHKYVYYFDSYGLVPSQNIEKYLKTSGKKILYNDNQIQLDNSIMCGYYTADFIKAINKGIPYHDFLYQFDPEPTMKNEKLIRSKYRHMIPMLNKIDQMM